MSNRSAAITAAALTVVLLAACNDGQNPASPTPLPPRTSPVSDMFEGHVDESGNLTFTRVGAVPDLFGNVSPAISGSQGVDINILGSVVGGNYVDVPNVSRTWNIALRMQNLKPFAIGSNYPSANPTTPDTSGVFIYLYKDPNIVTPVSCTGCTFDVVNAMGTRNFTNPTQKYFWSPSRPTASCGSCGTDTTKNNSTWQFVAKPNTAGKQVTAFSFFIQVQTAWPAANEATSSYAYDGTADSLPDTQAEPRWKRFRLAGTANPGTATWVAGTELDLDAATGSRSVYFSENDSIGTGVVVPANAMSAYMDVTFATPSTPLGNSTIKGVFGFVEPAGGKQVFIGISETQIGFVSINGGQTSFAFTGGTSTANASSTFATYRLRKFRSDSAWLCRGGVHLRTLLYANWVTRTSSFTGNSIIFGTDGNGAGDVFSQWQSVKYTIGSDGGSC